jgi:hypothetical protein
MVYKRRKKIELRKRKETDKEKKIKAKKERKKKFDKWLEDFRVTLTMFLLIGANLVFITSLMIQSFSSQGTAGAFKPDKDTMPKQAAVISPKKLKVEVYNGCGVSGVAKKLTDFLRQRNIDVVYFGNYEKMDLSETLLIDRTDYSLANARIIGKLIGMDDRMFPQISPQRQVDVTIIIGKNYSQLKAFE